MDDGAGAANRQLAVAAVVGQDSAARTQNAEESAGSKMERGGGRLRIPTNWMEKFWGEVGEKVLSTNCYNPTKLRMKSTRGGEDLGWGRTKEGGRRRQEDDRLILFRMFRILFIHVSLLKMATCKIRADINFINP